jgi:hypothetical protein
MVVKEACAWADDGCLSYPVERAQKIDADDSLSLAVIMVSADEGIILKTPNVRGLRAR